MEIKRAELLHVYPPQFQQRNNMDNTLSDTGLIANSDMPRKRAYWATGETVKAPIRNFRQIQYFPLPNSVPDLDEALSGCWVDCGSDLHNQLEQFDGAAKVWITVQVRYEPAKPETDKRQAFDQYLSAAPTRIFKRE